MKILTEKTTDICKYIFQDSVTLDLKPNRIICPDFIIDDMDASTIMLYEAVPYSSIPSAYIGGKYLFDGTDFTLNPNYIEPEEEPEE